MKKIQLVSMTWMVAAAFLLSSCGSNRPVYSSRAYQSRAYVSLIITPFPGFTMSHYPDGRYYHRNANGLIYWKGYDNRFFLDKKYVSGAHYSRREYNEWKKGYEQIRQNRRRPY